MFSFNLQAMDCVDCTIEELDAIVRPIQDQVTAWEETITKIINIKPEYASNVDKFNQRTQSIADRIENAKTQEELDQAYDDYDLAVKKFCEEDYMGAVDQYDLEISKIKTITEELKELVTDTNLFDVKNGYNDHGRYEEGRNAIDLYGYTSNILMGAGHFEVMAKMNNVQNYITIHEGFKQEIISSSYGFCKDVLFGQN